MSRGLQPNKTPASVKTAFGQQRLLAMVMEVFGVSRTGALVAICSVALILGVTFSFFFHAAPPTSITITTGPEGSIFYSNAVKYSAILAHNGVKVRILPSHGSIDNLNRLCSPSSKVDVGFVQAGITNDADLSKLVSLGSVSYQPLFVFYRGASFELLSELTGKRVAVGPAGSGTRSLALSLLEANDIRPGGSTALLDLEPEEASKALVEGKIDAMFLMSEAAPVTTLRKLLRTPGINLFDFTQAVAYTRRITYLNVLEMPRGAIDLGKNIPPRDTRLIGPMVELVARKDLHPALSDALLEAAREVHKNATMLQRRGEFPNPQTHGFQLAEGAEHFYKSGKSFFYRFLPFWLASLVDRVLIVFVPMLIIVIPASRLVPKIYQTCVKFRIFRWYRSLLVLEREALAPSNEEKRQQLLCRLDQIEQSVNSMRVPASFAEQFYNLRGHIQFVRARLTGKEQAA